MILHIVLCSLASRHSCQFSSDHGAADTGTCHKGQADTELLLRSDFAFHVIRVQESPERPSSQNSKPQAGFLRLHHVPREPKPCCGAHWLADHSRRQRKQQKKNVFKPNRLRETVVAIGKTSCAGQGPMMLCVSPDSPQASRRHVHNGPCYLPDGSLTKNEEDAHHWREPKIQKTKRTT